jgi:hypothetical protein
MNIAAIQVFIAMALVSVSLMGCGDKPTPPTPAPPTPTSTKCWDQIHKAGACNSTLLKCPNEDYLGKWSVYVVPCDDAKIQQIYDMDPGWGGAHLTMTGFQTMNSSQAASIFSKAVASMTSADSLGWHPDSDSFNVQQGGRAGVWRALGIYSSNLDLTADKLTHAGWDNPQTKGKWHMTLANMTNRTFQRGDPTYSALTSWFQSIHWAIVLVECYKGDDGVMYFHHQNGTQFNRLADNFRDLQI